MTYLIAYLAIGAAIMTLACWGEWRDTLREFKKPQYSRLAVEVLASGFVLAMCVWPVIVIAGVWKAWKESGEL